MILCHKCAGLLACDDKENVAGLRPCRCISGYVRGFEKEVTRLQAIEKQIRAAEQWIALYERQTVNRTG